MKSKKLKKKLVLQKATISDLSTVEKAHVKGGETQLSCYFTCDPCGDTFPDRTCVDCPRIRTIYKSCNLWNCDSNELPICPPN